MLTNKLFRRGLSLAAAVALEDKLLPAIDGLVETFRRLEGENGDVVKSGRTHLQDAVPITLAQEISGWRTSLEKDRAMVELALPGLTRAGDWEITCTLERYRGQPQRPLDFFLDRSAAPALTARSRQVGDRLTLPGRPGRSLKKWYVDEKIPRTLRDQLPVLESGGRVAGAAGLGPDAAFLPSEMGEAWHIRLVHPKFGEKN